MSNITHVITSISDAITNQLLHLIIEKAGPPPCKFAFIALGSEGRKEQTLSTDQDNAIIFEDLPANALDSAYKYFHKLANEVNTNLNKIGYRFCKGDIMAKNPKWTQPISVWQEYFTSWIHSSDPQSILDSSIFFDLRCVYGKVDLVDQLSEYIFEHAENQGIFFQHLATPILKNKSRLSIFGGIVGDEESEDGKMINIKKIQLPIIGFARIYALKYGINETNTLARISKLKSLDYINKSLADELILSYSVLLQLRLRFQAMAELNNTPPDNLVDIGQLTTIELTTLKKILSELNNLHTQLAFDFKGAL